ncbi:MAG: radical SAM protein [Armatimonadetes bacterium]|nr:radical SAM protein [Armatimonadota bacterium]
MLKPFDPWSSPLCTCPPKLALDPYCGCGYECAYCYVSAYNPRCWGWDKVRPKKHLLRRLERDIERLAALGFVKLPGSLSRASDAAIPAPDSGEQTWAAISEPVSAGAAQWLGALPVAVSNSSDPYPVAPGADERELLLTRRALEMLAAARFPLLVTTKSPLVVRDLDVLCMVPSVVAITVTTPDPAVARKLEPHAPSPHERMEALRHVARAGIPAACRIDPIIPGINDRTDLLRAMCDQVAEAGVKRVIASTYKYRPDSFRRLARIFPDQAEGLRQLLDTSRRISGYWYMRREVREDLLGRLRAAAHEAGLGFSVCREGIAGVGDGICDARDLAGT